MSGKKKAEAKPVQSGKPGNITAVTGTEELLRSREVKRIVAHMQKQGWQVQYADGKVPGSLDEAMTRNGFFDGGDANVLVVVTNPEKLDVDDLKAILARGETDVALLLDFPGQPAGNTKFGKFCTDLGKNHRSFPKPKDYQAPEVAAKFCMDEARSRGCTLPESIALAIVEVAGTNLGTLSFEMMKICTLAKIDGVSEINHAHAKGGVAPLAETPVTSIRDTLQNRNKAALTRALVRVKKTNKGDPTMHVTRVLGPAVLGWLSMADLLSKGMTAEDIAEETGLHPWYVKNKLLPGVRRWGVPDLEKLIRGLAETERAVLNGAVSPWILLNARLLEACG